ncbi:MAG: hypothetical protein KC731_27010, partial [Myxococcales bacterium]|nr:hypothetical protein [Myxococcales bacterium]
APIEVEDRRTETEKRLDESEEDDAERGLSWFYVDVEGGYQHVGLETFEVDRSNLTGGLVPATADGGFVGVGLGAQLLWFTIGPRFRVGFFPNWQMFSIGGELGFRIPIGIFEPHFALGGGFVALGSLGGALEANADAIDIAGPYGRVSGGLDFFLADVFSIGPVVSWEFMGLTRPGVPLSADAAAACESDPNAARDCALAAEGSGIGSAVSIGARVGLHF